MDWSKYALALIPVGLAGLVSLAWENSHALNNISHDLEKIGARFDRDEKELDHLRKLIEDRILACLPGKGSSDDGRK